jgi:hypothetical protein
VNVVAAPKAAEAEEPVRLRQRTSRRIVLACQPGKVVCRIIAKVA